MLSELLLSFPLIVLGLTCLALAVNVRSKSSLQIKQRYFAMMLATSLLIIEFFFELNSKDLGTILFWNNLEYIQSVILAPLFFLFALQFTGKNKWLEGGRALLIFFIPAICLAFLWTNDYHHLFYSNLSLGSFGPFAVFSGDYGPAFWLYAGSTHFLTLLSVMLLLQAYLTSSQLYKGRVRLILIAALLPIITHLVSLYHLTPLPTTYLSSLFLTASGLLIFQGIFRYELPDPTPLALDVIVRNMKDAVIVLDARKNVVHINSAAESLFGRTADEVAGKRLDFEYEALLSKLEGQEITDPEALEISKSNGDENRYYSTQLSMLRDRSGQLNGYILVLRDFTDEKMIKEALRSANSRLNLLSSLTRHDVLNQLTTLRGYSELLGEMDFKSEQVRKCLEGMVRSSSAIERFITFTREYETLGMNSPKWQRLDENVKDAASNVSLSLPEISIEVGDLEIFADLMLSRVFSNLFENSLLHGQHVTKIKVSALKEDKDAVIHYEDNGVGIPFLSKEKIFDLGYGAHTGLGLFVSRQILGITDCTITEKGTPNQGARFEIRVPCGRWRYQGIGN